MKRAYTRKGTKRLGAKSRNSKTKQKEKRIQQLEQEVAELKAVVSSQRGTVRIDENQLEGFLNDLTARVEWSTNRIIDESETKYVVSTNNLNKDSDENALSSALKYLMGVLFLEVFDVLFVGLTNMWRQHWTAGWGSRLAFIAMVAMAVDCFLVGIAIFQEKDKSFIVAFFQR